MPAWPAKNEAFRTCSAIPKDHEAIGGPVPVREDLSGPYVSTTVGGWRPLSPRLYVSKRPALHQQCAKEPECIR
jgi:hypothetical protein